MVLQNDMLLACASKRRQTTSYFELTVGSSSSSKSGSMNRARASAILMRHPPENSFVRLRCISGVKLRPCNEFQQSEQYNVSVYLTWANPTGTIGI